MARGRIQAYGDSTYLKAKFGAGYKISIITEAKKIQNAKDLVKSTLPNATLEDDSAGALLFNFPNSSLGYVGRLVEKLNLDPYVAGWGLSQTSLEQVFLTVIRNAERADSKKPKVVAVSK